MPPQKNNTYKIILAIIAIVLLLTGVLLFLIPPSVFPDPGMGFQVLRCMQQGGGFNNFVAPDQSDISQTYTEFLTWWSPGQYLVPYLFKLITSFNLGQAIAITVVIAQFSGLAGFYYFFKKIGFTPLIAAVSLVFIICQQAFVVPYAYYNGGEILLFAFEGWFLYGCAAFDKPGIKLLLFVLFAGWIGFFLKSSFIWMYAAGLCCLWIRLSLNSRNALQWVKKGLWIAVPAIISLAAIYIFFLSKGESPASTSSGLKIAIETFGFPVASPILSGFSVDELFNGLFFHTGKTILSPCWSVGVLLLAMVFSILLILGIVKYVINKDYKIFVIVFYVAAILFFTVVYLKQLNISYEARHFRIVGLLIVPGMIYLATRFRPVYKTIFALLFAVLFCANVFYIIKGYNINTRNARGITGIAQPDIDQASLNYIMKLDRENRNATFVFISDEIGLEIEHNRTIILNSIGDDLKINADDYAYDGFAGPLFIVLPESYNGPKEKMIMKSFPGYTGFNISMLSNKFVLYAAKMKR